MVKKKKKKKKKRQWLVARFSATTLICAKVTEVLFIISAFAPSVQMSAQ